MSKRNKSSNAHYHQRGTYEDGDYFTKTVFQNPGEFNTVRINDSKSYRASPLGNYCHSSNQMRNRSNLKSRPDSRGNRRQDVSCESLGASTSQCNGNKGGSTMGDTYDLYCPSDSKRHSKKGGSTYKSLTSTSKKAFSYSSKKDCDDPRDSHHECKEEYQKLLKQKNAEIKFLKQELLKLSRPGNNLETLTTTNDPLALKQEVQDLNIMLDEVEQERDEAIEKTKKLQEELDETKEILQDTQINLLGPLQTKVTELEKIVDEKESDIRLRYKWKLRKYKREMDMEKQINQRLKTQLKQMTYSSTNHISSAEFCDSQSIKTYKKGKKSMCMAENSENVNTLNHSNFSCTMRRNKSQTLNGNRAVNMDDLMKNNTPSQINTQKNLKEYFLKFDAKEMNLTRKMFHGKNEHKHGKHKESRKADGHGPTSYKSQKRKSKSSLGGKSGKNKKKTQKIDSNLFRKISSKMARA